MVVLLVQAPPPRCLQAQMLVQVEGEVYHHILMKQAS
jgi:hypothetical protein